MEVNLRAIQGAAALELYLTTVPSRDQAKPDVPEAIFAAVAKALRQAGARIFQERVFADRSAMAGIAAARAQAYGDLADGVPPAMLHSPPGPHGPLAGVQVHGIAGVPTPPVMLDSRPVGRVAAAGGRRCVALTGLTAARPGPATEQATSLFEQAERCLAGVGGNFHNVARTWLWLGDILAWYGPFNQVRNEFFQQRGLLGRAGVRLPASTGIGVSPAGDGQASAACALDLLAVIEDGQTPQYFLAGGNQDSPFAYGSAFSRAACAHTPAGRTIFVSGTAAIDAHGASCHIGDSAAQIEMTIANVRAVLAGQKCADADLVTAIAYCKTPEVEQAWLRRPESWAWPVITIVADVCRDELLFEIEATAMRGE